MYGFECGGRLKRWWYGVRAGGWDLEDIARVRAIREGVRRTCWRIMVC